MFHAAHHTREREREMSNHHRFRLSHLMPNSWFYKLRDMKKPRPANPRNTTVTRATKRSSSHYYHGTTTPKPLPLSPHQSYSYLQTKQMSLEKLHLSPLHLNPRATDIQIPKDRHHHHHHAPTSRRSAIVVDENEFQDLQLRPIRTRPTPMDSRSVHSTIASGTCPSSPRLRSRRLDVLSGCRITTTTTASRRRSAARRSFAVVKASTDPSRDFRESMVEMIVENDMRAPEDLEDLLDCYLSLNSREYHGVITEVFRGVWLEITDTWIDRAVN